MKENVDTGYIGAIAPVAVRKSCAQRASVCRDGGGGRVGQKDSFALHNPQGQAFRRHCQWHILDDARSQIVDVYRWQLHSCYRRVWLVFRDRARAQPLAFAR